MKKQVWIFLLTLCMALTVFSFTAIGQENTMPMISIGNSHSAAIKSDGSLWTWGDNDHGRRLGNGATTNSSVPTKIMDNVVAVDLGWFHSAAIKSDGSLWTWGRNSNAELGNGKTKDSNFPIKIMDNVVSVSLGCFHSAAIKSDGSLWTWGDGSDGRLGNGAYSSYVPIKIMDNVVSVSLGDSHSAAIKNDGSLWTWGYNLYGQLGNGTTDNLYVPTKIMDNVVSVSLGGNHSAAIKSDGSLWTWGSNSSGQLGNGMADNPYVPTKIMDNVVSVSLGGNHSAAIKNDGSLWTWGTNFYGQLGNDTNVNSYIPIKIMDLGSQNNIVKVSGKSTINVGEETALTAICSGENGNTYTNNIVWNVSDSSIIQGTAQGNAYVIKGIQAGTSTITATHTPSGATASIEITVKNTKSYEEYFADNIGTYIGQITGLELPYRSITTEAEKQGLIDWSLGLNQYWRSENGVAQGGEGHKRYFYNTVLLDLINKKFTSNNYKKSLKAETWSAMKDITDVMLTQVMNKVETNVDSTVNHWKNYGDKEDLFERFFVQDQLSSAERMKSTVNFANDFIDSADMFLTMEDFANTYSDYRTAYVESMQQVFALEAIKAQIGTKSSDLYKAVDDITFVLKDSQTEAFGHGIKNGCWQIFMTTIWTTAELVPGLGDALEMLNASLSVWQLGTDVLVPATCTLDSLCRMQAICEIEDACKQALNASYEKYKSDPCYDNAVELIGIYDFLMTIYEYGHNDSKVYADYYYNEGLLKIGDISEWIYGDSYESTMAWLNSYNGAIEDVKWYKSKAEIEYLNAQGVTSTVTVNIYCNGKIVGTMTYEQPYGSTFSILPIEGMQQVKEFKDIKLVKQYSDAYYDKAMTQRFQNPHLLTNPITLHVNVTLLKRVDITIPEFKVTLNGVPMDNKYLSYPAIVYNNITYFPMTFYDSRHMGLSTEYSLTNGLRINQYNTPLEKYEKITTTTPNVGQYEATIAEFPIYVNDKNINNFMEEYPLLLFRDVTYFPLTWRFAVEEFGWSYYFDTTDGLVINK